MSLDFEISTPNLCAVADNLARRALTNQEVTSSGTDEELEFGALELSLSPSPIRSWRRRSGPGAHQLARPISFMVAGTKTTRIIDASTTSATIIPTPISLVNDTLESENGPTTMTSNAAALVMMPSRSAISTVHCVKVSS